MKTNYVVTLTENPTAYPPINEFSTLSERVAIKTAKDWAEKHPTKYLKVSFFRREDGAMGFINPLGADVHEKNWTDAVFEDEPLWWEDVIK